MYSTRYSQQLHGILRTESDEQQGDPSGRRAISGRPLAESRRQLTGRQRVCDAFFSENRMNINTPLRDVRSFSLHPAPRSGRRRDRGPPASSSGAGARCSGRQAAGAAEMGTGSTTQLSSHPERSRPSSGPEFSAA